VNLTPGRDFVEFMRILNRRESGGLSTFHREDVLEAALEEATSHQRSEGVSAWLSPAARRSMLEAHAEGNTEIARRFLAESARPLFFTEPFPGGSEDWKEYPGLSPERTIEIALRIHGIVTRKLGLLDMTRRT
jgi:hypothetical protein